MATVCDQLPPEMIDRIAQFLPVKDVFNCMLVCKLWKEVISSEQFFKSYVLCHYDFEDEEEPSGHLAQWQNPEDCSFYWEENADKSNLYVFSDPPRRWKCGIVHLANYMFKSHKDLKYRDLFQAVLILMKIQKAAEELNLECGAYGSEEEGKIEVCLFPWSKDTLPTAEDISHLFHFNPEMCKESWESKELPDDEDDEEDDEEDDVNHSTSWNTLRARHDCGRKTEGTAFFTWLQKIFTPFIRIDVGFELMKPVPFFILAHLAPGWVGGVLTSFTTT